MKIYMEDQSTFFGQVVYYFDYRLHLIRGIPDIAILPSFHRCQLLLVWGQLKHAKSHTNQTG